MRVDAPQRSVMPVALLAVAWLAVVVLSVIAAWESYPRGGYEPPHAGFVDAIRSALTALWPQLFNALAASIGIILFPLTWLALPAPYRRTLPAAFISCAGALIAAYLDFVPPRLSAFALAVSYGVLACEGFRTTITYLVHRAGSHLRSFPADA